MKKAIINSIWLCVGIGYLLFAYLCIIYPLSNPLSGINKFEIIMWANLIFLLILCGWSIICRSLPYFVKEESK